MRDHSQHKELSRDEAVRTMISKLSIDKTPYFGPTRPELVALDSAFGRVLADDVFAKTDVPNVLTCAMDSIAVHWNDFASLPDGELPDTSQWVRGKDWEFANTGVAMPEGFDTAIVIEHVCVSDDEQSVTIDASPSEQFAGTRAAGSSMRRGDVIVEAGMLITPDVAARIASAGHASVLVEPKPRVAFIPTGNELVPANLPFAPDHAENYAGRGRVYESNGLVVRGKTEDWGGSYVAFDIVPDDRDAIAEALEAAMEVSDIIVLNAGSSKGSDDWSVEVLEDMGEIICHQTNHGPGHHSSYAILRQRDRLVPVVGISGPPGGASFTLNFYLRPLISLFLGLDPYPHRIPCRLVGSFGANRFARRIQQTKTSGETRPPEATGPGAKFFAVRFMDLSVSPDGELCATPVPGKAGSPATQHANAFYMLAAGPDDEPPVEGSIIEVELR